MPRSSASRQARRWSGRISRIGWSCSGRPRAAIGSPPRHPPAGRARRVPPGAPAPAPSPRHPYPGGDRDHRHRAIDHRQRSVQQVGTRERHRAQVAGLHQLQRGLARGRVGVAARGQHQPLGILQRRRDRRKPVVGRERQRSSRRLRQLLCVLGGVLAGEQQVQGEQFGRVGLGCGDRALGAGAHVDGDLRGVGQRRVDRVGDRQCQRPAATGGGERIDQVGGTAGLADGDEQHVAHVRLGAVDGQRRGGDEPGGQLHLHLGEVLRIQPGVVAGTARGDQHEARRGTCDPAGRVGELRLRCQQSARAPPAARRPLRPSARQGSCDLRLRRHGIDWTIPIAAPAALHRSGPRGRRAGRA